MSIDVDICRQQNGRLGSDVFMLRFGDNLWRRILCV